MCGGRGVTWSGAAVLQHCMRMRGRVSRALLCAEYMGSFVRCRFATLHACVDVLVCLCFVRNIGLFCAVCRDLLCAALPSCNTACVGVLVGLFCAAYGALFCAEYRALLCSAFCNAACVLSYCELCVLSLCVVL